MKPLSQPGLAPKNISALLYQDKKNPRQVFDYITGRLPVYSAAPFVQANPSPAYWGLKLEPVIAEHYAALHNVELETVGNLAAPGNPIHIGRPDRKVKGQPLGVEIKTRTESWTRSAVPAVVMIQVQWYMPLLQATAMDVAVLFRGCWYNEYRVNSDAVLQAALDGIGAEFWHDFIERDQPPPSNWEPQKADLIRRMLAARCREPLSPQSADALPLTPSDFAKQRVLTVLADGIPRSVTEIRVQAHGRTQTISKAVADLLLNGSIRQLEHGRLVLAAVDFPGGPQTEKIH